MLFLNEPKLWIPKRFYLFIYSGNSDLKEPLKLSVVKVFYNLHIHMRQFFSRIDLFLFNQLSHQDLKLFALLLSTVTSHACQPSNIILQS